MAHEHAQERLQEHKKRMLDAGGAERVEKLHAKGKNTARERIDRLADEGTFVEQQVYITGRVPDFGMDRKRFLGDGVVTGTAKIGGRQVFLSAQDFTVLGGSLGEMHADRIAEAQSLALKNGAPFIQINDSGGARIQEGVMSLHGYAKIFRANTLASGVIPQISVILGPCAGGAVYSPGITDFVFMVEGISNMYITGPDVIRAVTAEQINHEDLGGAKAHAFKSGNAHFRFSSEAECFAFLKRFMSYLPANNREEPPFEDTGDSPDREIPDIMDLLPENQRKVYDIRDFINRIVDNDSFLEIHKDFAQSVVVGFAKLAGSTVGIYGNQPKYLAGSLDINSSDKAARFVRFCDCFNIPIISFVDVPGFLPGVAQEHGGIIRHGAKLLYAIAEATVPKIAYIVRKAYGGAYIAMSAKALGFDRVLALPTAEIAVMGAEGAANIIFRRDINDAEDPDKMRQSKIDEFRDVFMNPFVSASYGVVDDVIEPAKSRIELIRSLEMMKNKREDRPLKKHGNIPL